MNGRALASAKQGTNKVLPCRPGSPTQSFAITYKGKESEKNVCGAPVVAQRK